MHSRIVIRSTSRLDEAGSGTAIGVAVIFPMLMLVIVALHAITTATRTEQALQSAVDRAAHAASLCCYRTGAAYAMALSALEPVGRKMCANDLLVQSRISILDVEGNIVLRPQLVETTPPHNPFFNPSIEDQIARLAATPDLVPLGGQVRVAVSCRLKSAQLGATGLRGLTAERSAIGIASIDPYRWRFDDQGSP